MVKLVKNAVFEQSLHKKNNTNNKARLRPALYVRTNAGKHQLTNVNWNHFKYALGRPRPAGFIEISILRFLEISILLIFLSNN
jgi:hypothetical protein